MLCMLVIIAVCLLFWGAYMYYSSSVSIPCLGDTFESDQEAEEDSENGVAEDIDVASWE